MEGVLVSAHRDASNITVTVVSDATGGYAFPATRLAQGHYALSIRAVGYDLTAPAAANVSAEAPASADLTLRKTNNLAEQLTNAEWMESLPGDLSQKQFLQNCAGCHTLHQPLFSQHTADEFVAVQERMSHYSAASSPLLPQVLLADRVANQGEFALERRRDAISKQANYLASVTMTKDNTWNFPLRTFARPSGRATHAVITEYDLPEPTRMPHDVIVTPDGTVWYDSFAEQILGRLDPATGKTVEYAIPTLKPASPKGSLALRTNSAGNLWIGMAYQGGVARFDPKTEKFQVFPVPPERNKDYVQTTEVEPTHSNVDGKVWIEDSGTYSIYRLTIRPESTKCFSRSRSPVRTFTTSPPMRKTTCISPCSGAATSAGSTRKPVRSRRGRRRRPIRRLAAVRWTGTGNCGSANSAPTRSACSIRRHRPSASGRRRRRTISRTTSRRPNRCLGWLRSGGPGGAARSGRYVHGIFTAEGNGYAAVVRGRPDDAGGVLGRRQSQCVDREVGTGGLNPFISHPDRSPRVSRWWDRRRACRRTEIRRPSRATSRR